MTRVPPTTLRWPWQRRLDAKRKREADYAARRAEYRAREERLAKLDPDTPCARCGHPLDAHSKGSSFYHYPPRRCTAHVRRLHEDGRGRDSWPCGCRDFEEPV